MFAGFTDESYWTGGPLDPARVAVFEQTTGYLLPESYRELLMTRNGGEPQERFVPTKFPTPWHAEGFEVSAILGVGGERGIDSPTEGSAYLVREWGYPPIGVVVCDTPSAGHDTVMLDYREPGEPRVAYVYEDSAGRWQARVIAQTFAEFLSLLRPTPGTAR